MTRVPPQIEQSSVIRIPVAENGTAFDPMHLPDGAVHMQVYGPRGAILVSVVLEESEAKLLAQQLIEDTRRFA